MCCSLVFLLVGMLTEVNGITTTLTIVAYYPSANVNGMLFFNLFLSLLSSPLCLSQRYPPLYFPRLLFLSSLLFSCTLNKPDYTHICCDYGSGFFWIIMLLPRGLHLLSFPFFLHPAVLSILLSSSYTRMPANLSLLFSSFSSFFFLFVLHRSTHVYSRIRLRALVEQRNANEISGIQFLVLPFVLQRLLPQPIVPSPPPSSCPALFPFIHFFLMFQFRLDFKILVNDITWQIGANNAVVLASSPETSCVSVYPWFTNTNGEYVFSSLLFSLFLSSHLVNIIF